MAIISIEKMEFYSYHGCFEEERKIGTWFNVDLMKRQYIRLNGNHSFYSITIFYRY